MERRDDLLCDCDFRSAAQGAGRNPCNWRMTRSESDQRGRRRSEKRARRELKSER